MTQVDKARYRGKELIDEYINTYPGKKTACKLTRDAESMFEM